MTIDVNEIIKLLKELCAEEAKVSVNYKKGRTMYKVETTVKELYEEDPEDD